MCLRVDLMSTTAPHDQGQRGVHDLLCRDAAMKRRGFAVLHPLQHNNDVWWQFDGKERDGERIEWIAQLHVTSFAPFGCLYALFDTPLTYANKPINPAQLA